MLNAKLHYLGRLCKYGHNYQETGQSLRYKSTQACVVCCKKKAKEYQTNNPQYQSYQKQYYQDHKAGFKRNNVRFALNHPGYYEQYRQEHKESLRQNSVRFKEKKKSENI